MILRRRRLWFVVLVGVALAGGVWVWAVDRALSCKDADRIAEGMSRSHIFGILGQPSQEVTQNLSGTGIVAWWEVCDGSIRVEFSQSDVAIDVDGYYEGMLRCQFKRLLAKLGY